MIPAISVVWSSSRADSSSACRSGGRQAIDRVKHRLHLLSLLKGEIGWELTTGEGLQEKCLDLFRADAAAAVQGEIPGDADEPDAQVADGGERTPMFEHADEDILHDIFGFASVAQDRVRYTEEYGGVCLDQGRQIEGRSGRVHFRQRQTHFLDHNVLLGGQTGEFAERSDLFVGESEKHHQADLSA